MIREIAERVRRIMILVFVLGVGTLSLSAAEPSDPAVEAARILKETGVRGGLVVHLGCGDGRLTAALRANESFQVHGLDRDEVSVQQARRHIRSTSTYGPVAVDRLTTATRLPYIDNFVNLLVTENPGEIPEAEILRVLAPRGVAYVRQGNQWKKTIKPRPGDIDDWTHFLHDASGNAVARDQVVGPPRRLQWVGNPKWSRHHDRMASMSALVSADGRLFYILDEGSRISIELPAKWSLIARDAFNGTVLWKQPIERWQSHLWPLKSGPTQLARRLVASGDRVYATLGLESALSCLDAATGEILREYEGTKSTEEVILADGVLYALVNEKPLVLGTFKPGVNVGDQTRVNSDWNWDGEPRRLVAIEPSTGRVLWEHTGPVAPLSLSALGGQVVFHDGEKVVCLGGSDGREKWRTPPVASREKIPFHFGPRVVLTADALLFAGGDRMMHALDPATGKELWNAPHGRGGYQSPEDLLVVGGLVWSAPTTSGRDSGIYTGRNLKTGSIEKEFPPDVETYWFHHRCYMAKATERYLLPSRTGIEFVDPAEEHWDINHWVRGGCLYGIMPCNGLIYAPPHDCACYPETKLFGINALAPASLSVEVPSHVDEATRLERGPAFEDVVSGAADAKGAASDWPTYRQNGARSGRTGQTISAELKARWEVKLGGRLSSVVVAGGRLYVAQIDQHSLHALDAESGEVQWTYMAGGRIDSPPTVVGNRVLFGSADGYVYCLRSSDGALGWRFRAAPVDRRLAAFEQVESVWPVHGSVLVQDGVVTFVAGRSNFLDQGLRYLRLELATGKLLSETIIDEKNPETGQNIQDRVDVLNMPVGLPDILSSDGRHVFMRSQQFDLEGKRLALGPHSGEAPVQGAAQQGEGRHLFAPMGFTDDTWFHRSYWVYGLSFAGGHNGYYQAGRFTPSGRIITFDDEHVYAFARKPQYYRWTTPLEHHLYASVREAPEVDPSARNPRPQGAMIRVVKSDALNPERKVIAVAALVRTESPNGVILAHGGPLHGYALHVSGGRPVFSVRNDKKEQNATAPAAITGDWVHLVGQLKEDGTIELYVDGRLAATGKSTGLLPINPAQGMEIGADDAGSVGDYQSPNAFSGLIDEVAVFHRSLTGEEITALAAAQETPALQQYKPVFACTFDEGQAVDESLHKNTLEATSVDIARGARGQAAQFRNRPAQGGGSFVTADWSVDLPMLARAMVLARGTVFVAGPPDLMDEEEVFQRLVANDPEVGKLIAAQDEAIDGKRGAILRAVSINDGSTIGELNLESPPVWDGMAAARGKLFLSTLSGSVVCLSGP